jgi:hypothetical protein
MKQEKIEKIIALANQAKANGAFVTTLTAIGALIKTAYRSNDDMGDFSISWITQDTDGNCLRSDLDLVSLRAGKEEAWTFATLLQPETALAVLRRCAAMDAIKDETFWLEPERNNPTAARGEQLFAALVELLEGEEVSLADAQSVLMPAAYK